MRSDNDNLPKEKIYSQTEQVLQNSIDLPTDKLDENKSIKKNNSVVKESSSTNILYSLNIPKLNLNINVSPESNIRETQPLNTRNSHLSEKLDNFNHISTRKNNSAKDELLRHSSSSSLESSSSETQTVLETSKNSHFLPDLESLTPIPTTSIQSSETLMHQNLSPLNSKNLLNLNEQKVLKQQKNLYQKNDYIVCFFFIFCYI